jgi:serine/threonine-protein kinase HipA
LIIQAKLRGLEHLVEVIECDMGSLDWKPETIDLLWSEGAAYNKTFEGALIAWRPLMAANGIAVISAMGFLQVTYRNLYARIGKRQTLPSALNQKTQIMQIHQVFEILGIHRLPSKAWWDNCYGPLGESMNVFKHSEEYAPVKPMRLNNAECTLFIVDGE